MPNPCPGRDAYELGTVTDLGRFPESAFDVALALGGALSYCFEQAPHALGELVRVTRPGGTVAVSVMNLFGTVHRFFADVTDTPLDLNRQIVATGDLLRAFNRGHECHMFRVEEARALLEGAGLEDVELHANGWLVPDDEAEVPDPDTDGWRFVLEMELEAGRESPGAGTHIIARGRKLS